MTGKSRNALATIGEVQDLTDVKAGALLHHRIGPLEERVTALERAARPWWVRLRERWGR